MTGRDYYHAAIVEDVVTGEQLTVHPGCVVPGSDNLRSVGPVAFALEDAPRCARCGRRLEPA